MPNAHRPATSSARSMTPLAIGNNATCDSSALKGSAPQLFPCLAATRAPAPGFRSVFRATGTSGTRTVTHPDRVGGPRSKILGQTSWIYVLSHRVRSWYVFATAVTSATTSSTAIGNINNVPASRKSPQSAIVGA